MIKKNLFIVFFVLLIIPLFSKTIICDYCHKPIAGEYIKVGDKYFHPEHFKCAYCNKPIKNGKFISYNGKYYCEDCFYKYVALKCSYCAKPLKGKYSQNFWGEKYHSYHEKEYPKCVNTKTIKNQIYLSFLCLNGVKYNSLKNRIRKRIFK